MTPLPDDRDEQAAAWAIHLGEDELSDQAQADLRVWLDQDRRNGEALEQVAGAWRAVEGYATTIPMMALREEALAAARLTFSRNQPDRWTKARGWPMLAAVAATLLLCLIGTSFWVANQPSSYATARGERRIVMLEDGSRLSLDASTAVRVKFSEGRRQLWLDSGRAKFDVAPDPLRPFSVAADDRVVVATGTSFSVELVGKQVRVALYEGHISVLRDVDVQRDRVTAAPASAVAGGVRMEVPGRELVFDNADGTPVRIVAPVDPVRSTTWQSGMLDFENDPLGVVIARTNRSATKPLSMGDADVAGLRVSGVFRAGDTDALVDGLELTLGIRAERRPDGITLYSPDSKGAAK